MFLDSLWCTLAPPVRLMQTWHMQAGMDLTGMSPFRNAQYTPSVPVQHGMYCQMPSVQNIYMDEVGQV